MKQKFIILLSIIIIVIGVVFACIFGFNLGDDYKMQTRLRIPFEESFNMDDVKQMADEVLGDTAYKIGYSDDFEASVEIYLEGITDEQFQNFENKLKEKYPTFADNEKEEETSDTDENKDEDDKKNMIIIGTVMPETNPFDLIKEYIKPVVITLVIGIIILTIYARKQGIIKSFFSNLAIIFAINAVYISLLAIIRIPLNEYIISLGILVYGISLICASVYSKSVAKN